MGIAAAAEHGAHVAEALALHAPGDRGEHLGLHVLRVDETVRSDPARQPHREPAAARADVGDDRRLGDAKGIEDLLRAAATRRGPALRAARDPAAGRAGRAGSSPAAGVWATATSDRRQDSDAGQRHTPGDVTPGNYNFRMAPAFFDSLVALIVRTSTDLPPDVRAAMRVAMDREEEPRSTQALSIIGQNIDQAAEVEGAICQDTGMPTFEVKTPVGVNQIAFKTAIRDAVAEATRRGKLRPNSVDSLTGENSGNNLGPGTPIIHFEQWEHDEIEVKLILKGGGCENMNAQYSLPAELPHLGRADRTIEGVRKCILHAVWQAQGKGCAPGALGVAIGGDRTSGYVHAKEQLFRTLDDVNPDARLAALEAEIMAHGQPPRRRHDGLRRPHLADRLQGRRAEPAAGELLRVGGLRLLGLPPPGRGPRPGHRGDPPLALPRSGRAGAGDDGPGRLPAHRPRGGADHAARRGDDSIAQGRRRGDGERAAPTPAATPCITT